MKKQKIEQYNLGVVDFEKEMEAKFEKGYRVVSMVSVTDSYEVPIKGLSQTHTIYVVFEYDECIDYPEMSVVDTKHNVSYLKDKDIKEMLMLQHVRGRRNEIVYYKKLPNENTQEYRDIMEYCYLNNIKLYRIK